MKATASSASTELVARRQELEQQHEQQQAEHDVGGVDFVHPLDASCHARALARKIDCADDGEQRQNDIDERNRPNRLAARP